MRSRKMYRLTERGRGTLGSALQPSVPNRRVGQRPWGGGVEPLGWGLLTLSAPPPAESDDVEALGCSVCDAEDETDGSNDCLDHGGTSFHHLLVPVHLAPVRHWAGVSGDTRGGSHLCQMTASVTITAVTVAPVIPAAVIAAAGVPTEKSWAGGPASNLVC